MFLSLSLALSRSLWLYLALSGSLSLSLALSRSLWLSLALSRSLWLSLALAEGACMLTANDGNGTVESSSNVFRTQAAVMMSALSLYQPRSRKPSRNL